MAGCAGTQKKNSKFDFTGPRDPSIASAMMGFFRKRTPDILLADADKEGWVTKVTDQSNIWLKDPERTWKNGLDIAETAAHLLEAGELTAMRIPPTCEVEMLRQAEVNQSIFYTHNLYKPERILQTKLLMLLYVK